jgi:hypothetical protein
MRCSWCYTDPAEAAARGEGPHATWCFYYCREQHIPQPDKLVIDLAELPSAQLGEPVANRNSGTDRD